jgi:adenosine deaminase/adenosine deaminase CECR1
MEIRNNTITLKFIFLVAVLLLSGCAENIGIKPDSSKIADGNSNQSTNYDSTGSYYQQLIAAPTPKIAELTLFTNMLPKGGDLHHHYSGAMYVETYLDWLEQTKACLCSDVECKNKTNDKVGFEIVPKFSIVANPIKGKCISVEDTKKDTAFYRELLKRWSDKDYSNHSHEQIAPDQQFFATFGFFGPASNLDYRKGLELLKQRAIAENMLYLETMLKGAPSVDNPELVKQLNTLNANSTDAQIDAVLSQSVEFMQNNPDVKASIEQYIRSQEQLVASIDDAQFKLRFQSYVSRNSEPVKVFSSLYSSFVASNKSKFVVGVNMVSAENGIIAMRDYSLHMKMFHFLKQRFPEVKIALHAGELVLGMVPPEGLKFHINEAVKIAGANRIGHGIDIAHETNAVELLHEMKQRNTAVEINLSSNEFILGVKNEAHPLQLYRQYGVPFVISTDDAGVSRNNLSNEYLLFTSRYKPSYKELKETVYNSIHYSFLSEDDKRSEFQELDKRFTAFEAKITDIAHSSKIID